MIKLLNKIAKKIDVPDTKSVFFVSLPKSGTVYTWNAVCDVTGLRLPEFHKMKGWETYNSGRDFSCEKLYACGDYNTQMLLPENMKYFSKGYFFGAHMQASYHNMRVLEESGIDKVTVLLRDPRDAFVSWVHHLHKLGESARNYHSRIYHIPRDYYSWTIEQQFDYQIRTFLPNVVNWVEGWLDYYASQDKKIDVRFLLYDELKRTPKKYIEKIVSFNNIDQADFSKIPVAEKGKMHFRKGEHNQWRNDFSDRNIMLAEQLMEDRIARGFDRAANSHASFIRATRALDARDGLAAAKNVLDVITDFSNSKRCYDIFIQAMVILGKDSSSLTKKVNEQLASLNTQDYFIYRDDLVEECQLLFNSAAKVA